MSSQLLRKYMDIINERVVPNADGTMSPSFAQQMTQPTQEPQQIVPSPAAPAPAPVKVNRETGTLEYQGREYAIARITKDGPQPRIPPGGVRTKVACADMGFRCLGAFDAVLFGDTAYVYIR